MFTVLIPVSLPTSGPGLLRVACAASPTPAPQIYAMHLVRAGGQEEAGSEPGDGGSDPDEAMGPLLAAADRAGVVVRPRSFVSRDVARDIADVAHERGAGLILMGWHKPIVGESILGGTVNEVMRQARADVAVYLERQFQPWRRILVPFQEGVHDRGALALAGNIAAQSDAEITIVHVVPHGGQVVEAGLRATLSETFERGRVHLQVVESEAPLDAAVQVAQQGFDLMIVGIAETWGREPALFNHRHGRLARECPGSILVVRRYREEAAP